MDLNTLQKKVDDWIKKYGVRYFDELTNMAILTEEVGEVARIMARKYGEQSFKEIDNSDLGEELAVKLSLEKGEIATSRYKNYLIMLEQDEESFRINRYEK